jgi:mannose-1-phosphate guanylyltransferase
MTALNSFAPCSVTARYWRKPKAGQLWSWRRSVPCTLSIARTRKYYAPLLSDAPTKNLVVQPSNRGTAPAILYSLLRIAARDPNAVVAFFPSDHYISDNAKFMAQTRSALDTAQSCRELVVLLGLEPESPEVEYGWIEPGRPIHAQGKIFGVRRFWEKPHKMLAQVLQLRGCLWNSFVMVASVRALLDVIESALPKLYRSIACLTPPVRHIG